jgi:predicted MFS family arabinose efflux permease
MVSRLDRKAPRRVLPVLYALEALAFASLALIAHRLDVVAVLVLVVLDGIIAVTARALARAASVAVLLPAGALREGNALMNAVFSLTYMAGPALGGVVVAVQGTVAALVVNSVLFAVIAVTLATARTLPEATGDEEPMPVAHRLRAGLEYVRERRGIRNLIGLQAVALAFYTLSIPVEIVLAQHTLHAGAGGYGALLSGWGAGAVVGSAVYARWRALPPRALIGLGAAALGSGFIVMAASPTIEVATLGSAVAGLGNGIDAVTFRTALQEQVAQRWMAVVMGVQESVVQAVPGLGIVLGGLITAVAGARAALAVAGGGGLGILAVAWVVLRPSVLVRTETLA